jgi:Fe-S-cluster-containing hydrogenase component 2
MKLVNYEIEIVDEACTGCYRCERACPTLAISMVGPRKEALAVVDNSRCIACFRCIDACDDDAMFPRLREEPLELDGELAADPAAVVDLCRAAALDPDSSVCMCTGTQAKDVATAILSGVRTFADLAFVTGVQSGCLMYCSVPLRRLLSAGVGEAESASKVRRYDCDQSLLDIPPAVAEKYQLFAIAREQATMRTYLDELDDDI